MEYSSMKMFEEHPLRHEISLIVALIVILKSIFFILKQRLQNDEMKIKQR